MLESTDSVRHNLMIPGLDPMFTLEFRRSGVRTARFVTPDTDVTLPFHCHVPTHDKMGMHGELVVGRGGAPNEPSSESAQHLWEGEGTVVSVDLRKSRIVVDHKEIAGFMAAMIEHELSRDASLPARASSSRSEGPLHDRRRTARDREHQ